MIDAANKLDVLAEALIFGVLPPLPRPIHCKPEQTPQQARRALAAAELKRLRRRVRNRWVHRGERKGNR